MGKSPLVPLAIGGGAMAAPFLFPSIGAAMGIAGPAAAAGGGSAGGIGALTGLSGAELGAFGFAPSAALGATVPGLGHIAPSAIGDAFNSPWMKAAGMMGDLAGGNAQQQPPQPPMPMAPPRPPPQQMGSLAEAAGALPTSQPPGYTGGSVQPHNPLSPFYLQSLPPQMRAQAQLF